MTETTSTEILVEKKSFVRKLKDTVSTHKTVIVLGTVTAVSVALNVFAVKTVSDNTHVDVTIDPIELDAPFTD